MHVCLRERLPNNCQSAESLQSKLQSLSSHHIEGSAADLELQAKSLRLSGVSYYVYIDLTTMQQDAPAGVYVKHALYICVVHVHMTRVMMEVLDCSRRVYAWRLGHSLIR
jgi:hypothetical protein